MDQRLVTAFFEDLAGAMDYWVNTVVRTVEYPQANGAWTESLESFERLSSSLGGSAADLRPVLSEAMYGLLHSVLTTIDGGTASAEVGTVDLVDADGRPLGEGLHELFADHLLDTGRLR